MSVLCEQVLLKPERKMSPSLSIAATPCVLMVHYDNESTGTSVLLGAQSCTYGDTNKHLCGTVSGHGSGPKAGAVRCGKGAGEKLRSLNSPL